jgi:beta-lactamase regulating signal transducer with metallopeptidase domain
MSWLLIVCLKNAVLVAPLALLALGLSRWCRRPALAHLVWVLVLVKLLTPPLVDVPVGWRLDVEGWVSAPTNNSAGEVPATLARIASESSIPTRSVSEGSAVSAIQTRHVNERPSTLALRASAEDPSLTLRVSEGFPKSAASFPLPLFPRTPAAWLTIAAGIWLAGSVAVAGLMGYRAWQFRRFLRLAGRSDERLARRIRQLTRAAGLTAQPTVRVVDSAVSPMLWGLGGRATLIFPAQLAERLEEDEIDSLLLHELAHFARGDHWVRLLELATHIVYWWHPVVWWARREIEAAEEACCDAWVVEHQAGSRRSYAEALLATIDFLSEQTPALPPAACGLGDVPLLRMRLKQIIRGETAGKLSRLVRAIVLCAGVVLSPLQPASWATSSPRTPKVTTPAMAQASFIPAATAPPLENQPTDSATPSVSESPAEAEPPAPEPTAADLILEPPAPLFATARSPNAKYRLEARYGRRTVLIHEGTNWKLDLSSYRIECASFAPDSRSFVTGHEDGLLSWWDSETGGRLASYRVGSNKITSVAFARQGMRVACGLSEGAVAVWDLTTGEPSAGLGDLAIVNCVRWSHGGDRLAISTGSFQSPDQATLLIWDPLASRPEHELALGSPAGAIAWTLGDDSLVYADWNGNASAWQFSSETVTPPVALSKDAVSAAAWSPDIPLAAEWKLSDLAQGVVR